MKKIRILIADDHSVVRIGLATLLKYESDLDIVAEADDGAAALARAKETRPDVAIIDLMMPVMNGVEATRAICRECPETRVLILTSFHDSDDVRQALDAGASGVIAKHADDDELISAIRTVAAGGTACSAEITDALRLASPHDDLTPRQLDILRSAARGLSNAEIGLQFDITKDMVKAHLKAAFKKLGAANRTEAVTIALRKNLLKM